MIAAVGLAQNGLLEVLPLCAGLSRPAGGLPFEVPVPDHLGLVLQEAGSQLDGTGRQT